MKIKNVLRIINNWCKPEYTEKWDNTGLQIGDPDENLTGVVVSLDADIECIEFAKKNGANLCVCHHPLIFSPLKKICKNNPVEKTLYSFIENKISLIVAHTNFDVAPGGVNDILCSKIGLKNLSILDITGKNSKYKVVCFIPAENEVELKKEISLIPGVALENEYSECFFSCIGQGSFKPSLNSKPYIGKPEKREIVDEIRLEFSVEKNSISQLKNIIKNKHPYEEPIVDIYELNDNKDHYGIGRIGYLSDNIKLKEFVHICKNNLNINSLRVVGDLEKKVNKIAVCSGSGTSFIKKAYREKCDVLLTGDCKYHDARLAEELGISIVDCEHFFTEIICVEKMENYLKEMIKDTQVLSFYQRSPFIVM